jgi:hypothetical protein
LSDAVGENVCAVAERADVSHPIQSATREWQLSIDLSGV